MLIIWKYFILFPEKYSKLINEIMALVVKEFLQLLKIQYVQTDPGVSFLSSGVACGTMQQVSLCEYLGEGREDSTTALPFIPRHSLIIVYVHPQHLPAVLALAGHEVVVRGIVGRWRPRLKAARPAIVRGVADRVGRLIMRGVAAGGQTATAAGQTVRAVVVVATAATDPGRLSLVAVAGRAPALRVVVVEGVVGGRAVGDIVLPLMGVGQQLLLESLHRGHAARQQGARQQIGKRILNSSCQDSNISSSKISLAVVGTLLK